MLLNKSNKKSNDAKKSLKPKGKFKIRNKPKNIKPYSRNDTRISQTVLLPENSRNRKEFITAKPFKQNYKKVQRKAITEKIERIRNLQGKKLESQNSLKEIPAKLFNTEENNSGIISNLPELCANSISSKDKPNLKKSWKEQLQGMISKLDKSYRYEGSLQNDDLSDNYQDRKSVV